MLRIRRFPRVCRTHPKLYNDQDTNLKGYFREITLLDQQIGKLREKLRSLKIEQNTLLFYSSDNGGLDQKTSGGRAKKGSIYEGGTKNSCHS
ncbi:MAG: hypothetical protein CM15mP130_2530 [Verrucomicrobiota bacterium]|nr:MAG: hypothetical protein CM15mP130_2530 [Verrucomicrobiota bacterium]